MEAHAGSTVHAESGSKVDAYSEATVYLMDDDAVQLRAHELAVVIGTSAIMRPRGE